MKQFKTPFSREYWKSAANELRSVRMLVIAALIVALRVALKSVFIPVGDQLNITVGFFANALGSMIYGPVLGLLSGMVSDLLGCILFPKGPFFPPFTLVEMLGSFIFALWLYRTRLTPFKVIASKLSVNIVCNIVLTPVFLSWMYGKSVMIYLVPGIAKNLCLFPLEGVVLTIFIGIMLPILKKIGIETGKQDKLRITKSYIFVLALLFVISVLAVILYYKVILTN